jgi:hypothetical protein
LDGVKKCYIPENHSHQGIADGSNNLTSMNIQPEKIVEQHTIVATTLAGTPFFRKSVLERYIFPISSSCVALPYSVSG